MQHRSLQLQDLIVLEPEHKSLNRGEVAGTKTDTHYKTVAKVNTDKGKYTALMITAVPDEEA